MAPNDATTDDGRTDSELPEYAQGFEHPELPDGWHHDERPRGSPIADCVARYRFGESAVQVVIYEMYNDGLDPYGVGVYTERECRDADSASIQAEAAEIARNMMLTEIERREDQADRLRDLYENARMWSPGVEFVYRSHTLKKAGSTGGIAPVTHTEFNVIGVAGETVESLTVGAFDDFEAFRETVDEIADYQPETMREWLNRSREGEA